MPVVRFNPTEVNFLEAGGRGYFVLSPREHTLLLVPDACPHRGGPLHLGRLDTRAGVLRCPWHERAIPLAALQQRAVPTVWRRGEAVAVLPGTQAEPVLPCHRRILATRAQAASLPRCRGDEPCP